MKKFIYLFSFLYLCVANLYAEKIVDDIKKAKVGECYKRVVLSPKYEIKEELIEVEKASQKIKIVDAKFEPIEKTVEISPKYIDIKESMAKFKTKKVKFPQNNKYIYYAINKTKEVPLSKDFLAYVEKKGVDLNSLKVGECYEEYVKIAPKRTIKKEYVKKQAYEIIDVAPAKFKTIKKKVLVKPEYTKIVRTPAVYETKIIKVLISPAQKIYSKKGNDIVCVKEKPAKYKKIVKKILKKPPFTKVIKFPATYKEVEVKVLVEKPVVTRRVVPPKKASYDFYITEGENSYFWLKEGSGKNYKKTGLKICKKESNVKYIEKNIEVVTSPATTKEIDIPAKKITVKGFKLVHDAKSVTINIPPQYEKVKSKVEVLPQKIVWKRIDCKDIKVSSK